MKAITLWQPYASLLVAGRKPHETRSWPPPDSLLGARIAIHAGDKRLAVVPQPLLTAMAEAGLGRPGTDATLDWPAVQGGAWRLPV